jgi:hypothetical protein
MIDLGGIALLRVASPYSGWKLYGQTSNNGPLTNLLRNGMWDLSIHYYPLLISNGFSKTTMLITE